MLWQRAWYRHGSVSSPEWSQPKLEKCFGRHARIASQTLWEYRNCHAFKRFRIIIKSLSVVRSQFRFNTDKYSPERWTGLQRRYGQSIDEKFANAVSKQNHNKDADREPSWTRHETISAKFQSWRWDCTYYSHVGRARSTKFYLQWLRRVRHRVATRSPENACVHKSH